MPYVELIKDENVMLFLFSIFYNNHHSAVEMIHK